jgi:HEAT repeats
MECEEIRTHFADYLAGTSAQAETDGEMAAHLRTCRTCARELEELRDTWHLLDSVPAEPPDSPAMRARFDATIAEYQRSSAEQSPARSRRTSVLARWFFQPLPQLGFAAAILLFGVVIGRYSIQPPAADPQIATLRQEVSDMRQMITLSLMQQQSASERLRGVTSIGQIDRPGNEVVAALIDTLSHDPNVNVRLASIDALRQFAGRENVRRGAIESLSRQASPLVQIALIDFLVEVAGRESTTTLRGLSQDPVLDQTVRERAAWALQQVS